MSTYLLEVILGDYNIEVTEVDIVDKVKDVLRVLRLKYWIIKEAIFDLDFSTQHDIEKIGIPVGVGNRYHASIPRKKIIFKIKHQ